VDVLLEEVTAYGFPSTCVPPSHLFLVFSFLCCVVFCWLFIVVVVFVLIVSKSCVHSVVIVFVLSLVCPVLSLSSF